MLSRIGDWWRPFFTALGLCLVVLYLQPQNNFDRRLSDKLLVRERTPTDKNILIVEIDAGDVREYGGPPIPREALARVIGKLADGGAERVMLDVFLGENFDAATDAALATQMARLGPGRLGLVTSPGPDDRPYSLFARHATLIDARLTPDLDGWHRRMGAATGVWGNNAARWLATGQANSAPVPLDLRIDSRGHSRRSARDVIRGSEDFRGKLVIVCSSTDIAASRAFLPFTARANRGAVIAVGTQSVRHGYPALRDWGMAADAGLQILGIFLGFLCAMFARSGRRLAVLLVGAGAVLVSLSFSIASNFAVQIFPSGTIAGFAVMANVTLVQRLKIIPMMITFLKGDLSPEEAWPWRSCENSGHAAVLFSADGRVKRANPAAAPLVSALGEGLAGACMPRLGERAEELDFIDADGVERCFDVDWPYPHVALALLRDNTEAATLHRTLREQLLVDELTGAANRRGFEHALNRAANATEPYTVFFMDLNGFKAVNDTHGHDAGDELLVIAADRLRKLVGPDDTVARLGGDEFAVVLPGRADAEFARRLAARIVEAIGYPVELTAANAMVELGVAVGMAMPKDADESTATVLRRADQAMYRDKLKTKLRQQEARRAA